MITEQQRKEAIERVTENWREIESMSLELRNDREVVLPAVIQDGRALRFASEGLRGDRDVVLAAELQNQEALRYASLEANASLLSEQLKGANHGTVLSRFDENVMGQVIGLLDKEDLARLRGVDASFNEKTQTERQRAEAGVTLLQAIIRGRRQREY
jgi:hypothetical protein